LTDWKTHISNAAGVALVCLTLPAAAASIDANRSSLSATFRQMNVPVEGAFKRISGDVVFDVARPQDARAALDIDLASFDLGPGTEDYSVETRRKDWFDTTRFPRATFTLAGARALGGDRFEARGKLSLKGRVLDLVANVVRRSESGVQVFEGQLPIRRLAFGIGEGEWRDPSVVADEVVVRFRLVVPVSPAAVAK
jgi:polyisoprenoid-binding protein YceI